jgi:2-keto-4-pentenoate hydratase/2-oxohepta-3-ene-1,7-dioic acid hydratase in catechol pathway
MNHVALRETGESLPVGKIVGVGRNYAAHVAEMNAPRTGKPLLFLKPSTALVPEGGEVPLPAGAGAVHHEVELVVVIGEAGKAIPVERALGHVLGYAVGLDMTLRDLQSEAKSRGEPWCVAKGFDGSAPVSSVVLRDAVGDGSALEISLDVNGERRQQGNTSQMLYGVAELVAFASRWFTLEPGDLLFTGTPSGVGPVEPGDRLEARIEKIGTLTVTARAQAAPAGAEPEQR